jgi:excinuclease ABC subunit A
LSIGEAIEFFDALCLPPREAEIARRIIKEISARLGFLREVGIDYLTLDRMAGTLSGGEAQRIRLATQIGSSLTGVLYILDEPSIGLHPRDNYRLLCTLQHLRELGNTVIVVEHDEETMRIANYLIDMGPGAGMHGGKVIAAGTVEDIIATPDSLTGQYLSGQRKIDIPIRRRPSNGKFLRIIDAHHNNLQHIEIDIPLGLFICVTGVSGSGKSSLIIDTLYPFAALQLHRARGRVGKIGQIIGLEHLDKVINIDQSPIGRTPRSNPATYVDLFGLMREIYSQLPESRARGYLPGRFSFNVKGGRCEACEGAGIIRIEMHFLPDVFVTCEECKGKRFNRETLEIQYRTASISDVLDMTVEEALGFFAAYPRIKKRLQTLFDVGLGYIGLGQSATTLSGGEAQRIKLAKELSRRSTGRTLYILDEPTTGLHFEDIRHLLSILHRLVDEGNSVIVIEHQLDVIKTADWIIDLGPEGGHKGGLLVAQGTPEQIAQQHHSHTGQCLRELLKYT